MRVSVDLHPVGRRFEHTDVSITFRKSCPAPRRGDTPWAEYPCLGTATQLLQRSRRHGISECVRRRKREQWRQLAEGAPDDATADYLNAYFEPTGRAIDGLEKALAVGLLDQALAMDLRKPQDYFHRIWATAFRATYLAATTSANAQHHSDNSDNDTEGVCA
ncbi:MAG: hypothetical protein ACYDAQ_01880 [Mycobacteriales bacterium]